MSFQNPSDPEEELPDWLQGLGEDSADADSEPASPVSKASTSDLPEWLQRDGERSSGPLADDSGEEMPGWLATDENPAKAGSSAAPTPDGDEEAPDWLNSIREQETENRPSAISGEVPGSEDDGIPSWLEEIRQKEQTEQTAQGADESTSDYIERIRQMKAQDEAAVPDKDTSGWLKGLEDDDSAAHVPGKSEQKSSGEWTGWGNDEDDTDDWLASLGEKGVEIDLNALPGAGREEEKLSTVQRQKIEGEWAGWKDSHDDTDDWLAQIEQKQSGELVEDVGEQEWMPSVDESPPAGGQIEDTASWLAGLADEDVEESPATETPTEPEMGKIPVEDAPDWLSDLEDEVTSPQEGLPSWMGEAAKTSGLNIKDVDDENWLNVFEDDQPMATLTSQQDELGGFEDEFDIPEEDQVGLPEWMRDLGSDQSTAAAAVEEEFPDLPEEAGELPNWISDLQGAAGDLVTGEEAIAELGGSIPAFTSEPAVDELDIEPAELPDWLGAQASAGEQAAGPQDLSGGDGGIAHAELPSWLQAMRPVESGIPGGAPDAYETGEQVSIGPLAGLSGVLPAEPGIVQFGKVPSLSMKLAVSEGQLTHARILEQMVASEGETKSVKFEISRLPQRIMRWIIAVVLLLAVLVPVLGRKQTTPLPNIQNELFIQSVTLPVTSGIEALPPEANVLVAIDYQPGLYGEMTAAASGLFDHLLGKGAKLAYMSTEPTGPGLARRFFADTQSDGQHNHTDRLAQTATDLGYLAGGTAGLQLLAQNPIQAMPTLNTSTATLPGFGAANDLNYFNMVIVVTDDADTARAWVEQVQPRLHGTPLYMVISAQAEPLVYPYFESNPKQIDGLIVGAAGGAAYEQITGNHIARKYWNAYSTGVSISLLIIVIGGVYSLVQFFIARLKERNT
jgi:hypothetical protein